MGGYAEGGPVYPAGVKGGGDTGVCGAGLPSAWLGFLRLVG